MTKPSVQVARPVGEERSILGALEDRPWHTSAEIIDDTQLLPLSARLMLRDLAGRGLIRRGVAGVRGGRWQITGVGIEVVRSPEPDRR